MEELLLWGCVGHLLTLRLVAETVKDKPRQCLRKGVAELVTLLCILTEKGDILFWLHLLLIC